MNSEELLSKCADYDHTAWNIFIKRYKTLITKSVRYKLAALGVTFSSNESNDIVQQIFFELWEKNKLKNVRSAVCLEKWLIIVSLNITLNYCKEKTFRDSRKIISFEENLYRDNSKSEKVLVNAFLPNEKFNSARILESHETCEIIRREISKLEYRQQLVLKFNLYHGKTQKDIAEIMNIPGGTVASLIKRAKELLRKNLNKFYKDI